MESLSPVVDCCHSRPLSSAVVTDRHLHAVFLSCQRQGLDWGGMESRMRQLEKSRDKMQEENQQVLRHKADSRDDLVVTHTNAVIIGGEEQYRGTNSG
jgi:hypothetical protein